MHNIITEEQWNTQKQHPNKEHRSQSTKCLAFENRSGQMQLIDRQWIVIKQITVCSNSSATDGDRPTDRPTGKRLAAPST